MEDDADALLASFMAMGTTDKSELVHQFMQVVPGAPREAAEFFLEATGHELQTAIWSYLENGGTGAMHSAMTEPNAVHLGDVTIGEGEAVPPQTKFTKTWRIGNPGPDPWPRSTILTFCQGDRMRGPDFVHVPPLEPGSETEISVDLISPQEIKTYAGSWRLCHREGGGGAYFGDEIWVVIQVAEGGLLNTLQGIHGTSIGGPSGFGGGVSQMTMPTVPTATHSDAGGSGAMAFGRAPAFGSLSSHTFGAGSSFRPQDGHDGGMQFGEGGGFPDGMGGGGGLPDSSDGTMES
eukprot:m.8504 g.8504  ORF g.8504 m.8504 type:complete len:292 (+) comp2546_c0_seq1:76-951(+)